MTLTATRDSAVWTTSSGNRQTYLSTKITIPSRRTPAIVRHPLVQRLASGKTHSRLSVIIAPAGFGKTTLARQWALNEAVPVAWVSLDTGENDPGRFLTYLTMAIRRILPEFGEGVLSLLTSPQPPTCEDSVMALLNALHDEPTPFSLILDDYHLVTEPTVHETVTTLLDHLPETVHLVIASRVDPPLPLARLRARGELNELRATELRCGMAEVATFLSDIMGIQLCQEQISALAERTEGWMAGLQLAGLSLQHHTNPSAFIADFTGSNRYIVDYLGEEVLRKLPDTVRHFLYRTSILERLHGPLCEAVVGNLPCGGGQAILEEMESANLFLVALDDCRRWYRYHHLFGDMLRARLLLEAEAELPELHRRAMQWYLAAGMFEEAIHHALAGGHFTDAARLMEDTLDTLWRSGESLTPRRWLAQLPPEVREASPILLLFQARYHILSAEPDQLTTILAKAERLLTARGETSPHLWGQYTGLRAFEATFTQRDDEAIALAEEALRILPGQDSLWTVILRILLGTVSAERGDIARGLEYYRRAASDGERIGDAQVAMVARSQEAALYEAQGQLSRAEATYRHGLDFLRVRRTGNIPMTAYTYAGLGSVALARHQLGTAQEMLQQALQAAREMNACDISLRISCLLIQLLAFQGNTTAITPLLDELDTLGRTKSFLKLQTTVQTLRAFAALLTGNSEAIATWERQLYQSSRATNDDAYFDFVMTQTGPPSLHIADLCASMVGRYRLACGREDAIPWLTRLLQRMESEGRCGDALRIRLLLATAYAQTGEEDAADAVLLPTLEMADREGYLLPFVCAGNAIIPLLKRASSHGNHTDFTRRLLKQLGVEEEIAAPVIPSSGEVYTLTDREREILAMVATGLSNLDIANRLYLSLGTVKRHLHNILGKLDADSRVAAIARARECGILP